MISPAAITTVLSHLANVETGSAGHLNSKINFGASIFIGMKSDKFVKLLAADVQKALSENIVSKSIGWVVYFYFVPEGVFGEEHINTSCALGL